MLSPMLNLTKNLTNISCNYDGFYNKDLTIMEQCIVARKNCDGSFDMVNFFAVFIYFCFFFF